jgi:hypothetical protein
MTLDSCGMFFFPISIDERGVEQLPITAINEERSKGCGTGRSQQQANMTV